jgi:hypothetical protein
MRVLVTGVAILLAACASARAGQVVSPPLVNGGGVDTFHCEFLNVGRVNIDNVTVQLVDGFTGNPAVESGPLTLHVGNERLLTWETSLRTGYCRAIGGTAVNPRNVLVTLCNAAAADTQCRAVVTTTR